MFRVVFFMEDKNVVDVLYKLSGTAMNLEVAPVVNAVTKKPRKNAATNEETKVVAANVSTDVQSMLLEKMGSVEAEKGSFGVQDVEKALKALGRPANRSNAQSYLNRLKKHGSIICPQRALYQLAAR